MQLSITFRHMESSDAVREYAREKVERIRKYFPDPLKGHIVFSCDRGYNHIVDVQITLHNGIVIKGVESTEDMYSSVDLVMAKIERQVRKYKERIRDHKPSAGPQRLMRHRVFEEQQSETAADSAQPAVASAASAPRVIKEEKYVARPMSVEEAIMHMNLMHEQFLCFNNALTHEVNVIYRRDDGSYGLIETHEEAQGVGEAQA